MDAQAFWAPTVSEAMKQVADELGVNAMILSTEETAHPSFPMRKLFCVTAIPGVDDFGEMDLSRSSGRRPAMDLSPEREDRAPSPILEKEHVSLLTGLLNQLQILQTELKDLRSARDDWERTTQLCEDLRAEVSALGRKMDSTVPVVDHRESMVARDTYGQQIEASDSQDLKTAPPLWLSEGSTLAVVKGSDGSGKTLTTAKIAAEASASGKSVALIDLSGKQELERLGNRIGVPTWNVPQEGSLEQVLTACAGLDLVLIDCPEENPQWMEEFNLDSLDMAVHNLMILPATLDREHLELSMKNAGQIDSVAVSKLDENNRNDSLLAVLKNSGYPISHVCTGKGFPGDIRQVNLGELIAEMRAA